jgi:hypothetical protein
MRCRYCPRDAHKSDQAGEWLCYRHALPHMTAIPVEELDNWENAMRGPKPKLTVVEVPRDVEVVPTEIFRRPGRFRDRGVHGLAYGKAA